MTNLYFPISGFFVIVLLLILFFSRKRIDSEETKIYSLMLISSFLDISICLTTILLGYLAYNDFTSKIIWILNKIDFIHYIIWTFLLFLYVYYITYKNNDNTLKRYNKLKKRLMILNVMVIIMEFFLPLNLYNENGVMGISGFSTTIVYITAIIYIILILLTLILNIKKVFNKKYIPIFVLMILLIFVAIIRVVNPTLLIIPTILVYIDLIMYFTIENPDIKLLNELYKNKELVEQGYEDKYNFLFEMTEQVKRPLIDINQVCLELKNEEDIKNIKGGVNLISSKLRELDFSINNILDISSIDAQKLKLVDTKYNLDNFFKDLIRKVKMNSDINVDLRVELPNNLPILYGDYIKLKQIIYSILINSCRNNPEGTIEFKVNLLERYDACRIIFTILDNRKDLSLKDINEILSATGEFSPKEIENLEKTEFNMQLCQKVIKFMGGHLMIKSSSKGTETTVVIDQKMVNNQPKDFYPEYKNFFNDYKRVLVISQDKELVNNLKRLSNKYNLTIINILYGTYAIDRLKTNTYDYILISDSMKKMNGYEVLQEIKKLNLDIPVMVMLDENNKKLGKHFIEDGFTDYIIINDLENELTRIFEKFD